MKHFLSLWLGDVGRTLAMTVGSPSAHRRGTMLKPLFLAMLFLIAGIGNVWAGSPATLTIQSGNCPASATGTATDSDGNTWTLSCTSNSYVGLQSGYLQCGSGSKSCAFLSMTTSGFAGKKISSVVVTAKTNGSASCTVTCNGENFGTSSQNVGTNDTEMTFSGDVTINNNGEIVVNISRASSAKKNIMLKSIVVNYTDGGSGETTVFGDP